MLIVMVCGGLAGCKQPDAQSTVDRLFSFLQSAQYPLIYQLLTNEARNGITLVDLSQKYSDTYAALGVKNTACALTGMKTVDSRHMTASFTISLTTDKLGPCKLDMEAPLVYEGGKWLLAWTEGLILPGLEPGDKVQILTHPASRGEIFDVNGEVLAKNDYALSVYVDTSLVENYETLIRLLAPEIGMTEGDIRAKLASAIKYAQQASQQDDDTVPPQAGLSETGNPEATPAPTTAAPQSSPAPSATATAKAPPARSYVIKTFPKDGLTEDEQNKIKQITGVGIDDSWMTTIRTYPYGDLLAQTLGYTGKMTQAEAVKPENAGLSVDAVIGQSGLESAFEQELRGQPGYDLVITDSSGNAITTLAQKAGADGKDLRLTIDANLQQRAEMLLRQYLTPEMAGSVIVLDPKTGYIQAMASAPSFDPNIFSFPVSPDVMKTLNDPASMKPFINRATSGLYPPGSTFKPFTAAMALSDGVLTTNSVFPYDIVDNRWQPTDWSGSPIKRMDATQGTLNLQNAITYSDNIFFAWVAMKVGENKFYQHCLDLGFTTPMKFDLPLKTSSISNAGTIDGLRQLADSGYGQGELVVTPVQMAALFGSLDNNGDIMLPRLVQSICHTQGPLYVTDVSNPKEVWKQNVVTKRDLNILLPDLKLVAQKGTAKALNQYKNLKDYEICAKTGTAEIGSDKTREIAWLIGFTTQKMDRLVCVTIEVPATKGDIRTDIARQMFYEPEKTKDTQDSKDNPDKQN